MDSNNFVGASGAGFDVYVGGKKIGSYPTRAAAQDAYNAATGTASTTGSPPPGGGDAGAGSLQALLDAIASGDREKFQEMIRQYNLDFGEKKREYNTGATEQGREFDTNTNLKNREDYSSLASDLLKTAASLRGPQDYFQYQKMLSGGKDLFQQLYGDQPRADFSNPTGQITPTSVTDIMSQLGFTKVPETPTHFWDPVKQNWFQQPAAPTASTPASPPSIATGADAGGPPIFDTGGRVNGPPGSHILAILKVGERVLPVGKSANKSNAQGAAVSKNGIPVFDWGGMAGGPTAFNPAASPVGNGPNLKPGPVVAASGNLQKGLGLPSGRSSSGSYTQPTFDSFAPSMVSYIPPAGQASPVSKAIPQPTESDVPTVPMPYQINPAVWDSLGKTGQALALSAASAAGWDANDYVEQINAQRPKGVAPAASIYDYYRPGSSWGMGGIY